MKRWEEHGEGLVHLIPFGGIGYQLGVSVNRNRRFWNVIGFIRTIFVSNVIPMEFADWLVSCATPHYFVYGFPNSP